MAAKLRLCLMVHVEAGTPPLWETDRSEPLANAIGTLAHVLNGPMGAIGAKLSVQVDWEWLNVNASGGKPYLGGPSSLRLVLDHGGNFMVHMHESSADAPSSRWVAVASAYATERDTPVGMDVATPATAGRSGGAAVGGAPVDWVNIAVAQNMRVMNSNVVNYYARTPQSLRPYEMSDEDIQTGPWKHHPAPGPIQHTGGPTTLRQRPFWVCVSSAWDASSWDTVGNQYFPGLSTIDPTSNLSGSLVMIPHPTAASFGDAGSPYRKDSTDINSITVEDFRGAMTEVWNTHQQMINSQPDIGNVWYMHLRRSHLVNENNEIQPNIASFGWFASMVNSLLPAGTYQWRNMFRIASIFADPTSRWF